MNKVLMLGSKLCNQANDGWLPHFIYQGKIFLNSVQKVDQTLSTGQKSYGAELGLRQRLGRSNEKAAQ